MKKYSFDRINKFLAGIILLNNTVFLIPTVYNVSRANSYLGLFILPLAFISLAFTVTSLMTFFSYRPNWWSKENMELIQTCIVIFLASIAGLGLAFLSIILLNAKFFIILIPLVGIGFWLRKKTIDLHPKIKAQLNWNYFGMVVQILTLYYIVQYV